MNIPPDLPKDIKALKQALRLVLRAASALEAERVGKGSLEDFNRAKASYDAAVVKAQKVLKEVS